MSRGGRLNYRREEPLLLETEPLVRAAFLDRLNRFTARCRIGRRKFTAYIANPGRLEEILLPGTELLLAPRPHTRMGWEAVGATWQRRWPGDQPRSVYLNASHMNRVARRLIEERLIPELAEHEVERGEYVYGKSRIDFLLSRRGRPYLLEVKSVTLVEEGLGFFPDAVTERGRRHLEELSDRDPQYDAGVLFLIQGRACSFLPDFQNDPEFAGTFQAVSGKVDFLPYCISPVLTPDGRLRFEGQPHRPAIPFDLLDAGMADGGVYIFMVHLAEDTGVEAGALGLRRFRRGWYLYAGSARRHISRRIERHLRRRKRFHFHIDYLREKAESVRAFPIRASAVGECKLAGELGKIGAGEVQGFGCSDCSCRSHLFYFSQPPVNTPGFQRLLTRLRHTPTLPTG